jgi:hypothetical protein
MCTDHRAPERCSTASRVLTHEETCRLAREDTDEFNRIWETDPQRLTLVAQTPKSRKKAPSSLAYKLAGRRVRTADGTYRTTTRCTAVIVKPRTATRTATPRARQRGAGRPRAAAARSSARSGDSGSDSDGPGEAGPSSQRLCAVCRRDISHRRKDARTCGATCRKGLQAAVAQTAGDEPQRWVQKLSVQAIERMVEDSWDAMHHASVTKRPWQRAQELADLEFLIETNYGLVKWSTNEPERPLVAPERRAPSGAGV